MLENQQMDVFVHGSIFKHIIKVSLGGMIGGMSMFFVQFIDVLYLSRLSNPHILSAMSYASTILFFTFATVIATSISASIMVSAKAGIKKNKKVKEIVSSLLTFYVLLSVILTIICYFLLDYVLNWLGLDAITIAYASQYVKVLLWMYPLLMFAMIGGESLRAVGKIMPLVIAMIVISVVDFVLDPIFIFYLKMGMLGAGISTAIAQVLGCSYVLYPVLKSKLLVKVNARAILFYVKNSLKILSPLLVTEISTPISQFIILGYLSEYGDNVIAGWTVINQVMMPFFMFIFCICDLSSIFAQNLSAKKEDRLYTFIKQLLLMIVIYGVIASLALFSLTHVIGTLFKLNQESLSILIFFATFISYSLIFQGFSFLADIIFNTTGKAMYSLYINATRNTIGIVVLIYIFKSLYQYKGVLMGNAVAMMLFSLISLVIAVPLVKKSIKVTI